MEWLNYHHLLYFWTVAREGSVARACDKLHLAQPTISGQLRKLEKAVGRELFHRVGRNLVLTETGRTVYRYAEEIFTVGGELIDTLRGRGTGRPLRLVVGIADVVPKLIAYRIIEPALRLPEPIQVICHDDKPDRLLAELSVQGMDIVLSDSPVAPTVKVRAFSHLLGECSVSVFGTPKLAAERRRAFPRSLDGAPILLPAAATALRRALDQWFDSEQIRPQILGEFDDSALIYAFGGAGVGLFFGPTVIESQVRRQHSVRVVGRLDNVREQFYAISVDRKLKHPAVVAISEAARRMLVSER
jgi:LysR family transcriptional activator of nhaA